MTKLEEIPARIEGRLCAHRQVLATLVAYVFDGTPEARERVRTLVSNDMVAANHSEDPGVIPDAAFAIEASVAEEIRLIAEEAGGIRNAGSAS